MRRWVSLGLVALAVSCGKNYPTGNGNPYTPPPPGPQPPPPPPPPPGAASVMIVDNSYSPGAITTSVGTTVVWTNTGSTAHTVTADGGAFSSAQLAPTTAGYPGGTFQYTFTAAGTFNYHCTIHSGMTGTVTVVP
jgi:hypothetical protein